MRRVLKPKLSVKNAFVFFTEEGKAMKLTCAKSSRLIMPESRFVHGLLSLIIRAVSFGCGGAITYAVGLHTGLIKKLLIIFLIIGLAISLLFACVLAMGGMYLISYRPYVDSDN